MKNRIEMYCINCGKQVNGNIPVCSDCAMLVIQEQLQSHKLAEKIDIEAQEFSLTNENEPESIPDSITNSKQRGRSDHIQNNYNCCHLPNTCHHRRSHKSKLNITLARLRGTSIL